MADPLSILIGGRSQAGMQRDAMMQEAAAQGNKPSVPPTQAQPQAPPATNTAGMPTFMASAATAPPSQSQLGTGSATPQNPRGASLLGQ